ncbi:B12-binding domain-containing radical SAM protein [Candidatus Latescibacterota bacterium]
MVIRNKDIKTVTVVFINPSRYDDDGYVIRYLKGVLPCNTLACMHSLTLEFSDSWKRHNNIDIRVKLYDEVVESIPFKRLAKLNSTKNRVVAAIVGVQSNQFPRASDIAKTFSSLGIKTLIGGFHVSGIVALFGKPTIEMQEVMDAGVTLVHGEAENQWEHILSDVLNGTEKSLYRQQELPDIYNRHIRQVAGSYMKKFALPDMGTLDCSRGCPFGCTFCTVINVQGRKMRYRSAECVLETISDNYTHGINRYFFTDDNFSRNPDWEKVFDGLIYMIEKEGKNITFMMQVDTRSHKIRNFISKAARAGCTQVFIGMESLNPRNLQAVGKNQNKVDEYAEFIDAWHKAEVMTHVGYIIGFPFDTPESVHEDIRRLKDDIKVDQASFFMLTPLPGSIDHLNMVKRGDALDHDLNNYDSFHAAMNHPLMSAKEWYAAYNDAWESFYSFENLKKVLIRAGKKGYWNIFKNIMWYKNSLLEPRHPMVAGFVRRKSRTDVRQGTPVLGRRQFYVMCTREMIDGFKKRISLFFELQELWQLTRKPDDPVIKYVADFTTYLSDMKNRFDKVNTCEELETLIITLRDRTRDYYANFNFKGKTKKRFEALLADMNNTLDRITTPEQLKLNFSGLSPYIATITQQVENFSLKNVARRRHITNFWFLTWERIRNGKVFSFTFSIPRIVVSAIRGFRMSLSFAYHMLYRSF